MTERRCALCGGDLTGRRADARFCSPACRRKAHRLKRAAPPSGGSVRYGADMAPPRPDDSSMPMQCSTTKRERAYFSTGDAERVRRLARSEGLSVSAFLRRAALRELNRSAKEIQPMPSPNGAAAALAERRRAEALNVARGAACAELGPELAHDLAMEDALANVFDKLTPSELRRLSRIPPERRAALLEVGFREMLARPEAAHLRELAGRDDLEPGE